jgi:phosphoglycolate phosphatase
MQKKAYQLLIFDWDGTIVDSLGYIILRMQNAARELKLPIPTEDDIRVGIGLCLADQVARLFPGVDPKDFAEVYYQHYVNDQLEMNFYAGAVDTLATLKKRGFTLAVATSKARRSLEYVLKIAGLGHYFSATQCGDDGFPKPNPEMIYKILDDLAVDKKNAIMIGDTSYDMLLAKNAGVDGLAVTYGVHNKEQLTPYAPVGYVEDIKNLLNFFSKP